MSTPTNGTLASIPACVTTIAHDGTVLCSWSDNPSFRGTLNILTLCLSTLGLSVWNAVHPDVPYPGTPKWRVVGKRVWWLLVGLFMPEMLVLTAFAQFRQAYTLLVRISQETRVPTEFPWWMTVIERWWPTPLKGHEILPIQRTPSLRGSEHASPNVEFNDMTTLSPTHASDASLPVTAPAQGKPSGEEGVRRERKHPWTLTHSFYAVMHGFLGADGDAFWRTEDDDGDLIAAFDTDKGIRRISASSDDAFYIPDVSVDDLDDRSKAGAIAKALLVWQFSVFVANCAARWSQSLPLSLLEITTLAHSLCSLIALGLWWYKPHSVCEATVRDRTHSLPSPPKVDWSDRAFGKVLPGQDYIDIARTIAILGIAVLYGLPHLLGLSVHFLTSAEQLCWQIATFTVICSPLIICALFWITRLTKMLGPMEDAADATLGILFHILVVLYPVASTFLVGESVRQIFALPEGSFHEPQLTRYLPSFS